MVGAIRIALLALLAGGACQSNPPEPAPVSVALVLATDGWDLVVRAREPLRAVVVDIEWPAGVHVPAVRPLVDAGLISHDLGRSEVGLRVAIGDPRRGQIPSGRLLRIEATGALKIVAAEAVAARAGVALPVRIR